MKSCIHPAAQRSSMSILSFAACCLFANGSVVCGAGEEQADAGRKYTLRYRFVAGNTIYYEDHQHVAMTMRQPNFQRTDVNDVHEQKHFRILSVDARGIAEIETAFDHVRMKAQFGNGAPVLFSSSDPPDKVPVPFRKVMESIGQPRARLRVRPTGQLAGEDTSEANPLNNFLVAFPTDPVAVGETWTNRIVVPVSVNKELERKVTLLRTYRLRSVKDGIAEVTLATSILDPVKAPQLRTQLVQRTPSGTIRFDMNHGRIESRKIGGDETVLNAYGASTLLRAKYTISGKRIARAQVIARAADRAAKE